MTTNAQLFARSRAVIPGGVNSPVRAFGSVGGAPLFIASARGPYVVDAEGREYVDLVGSWGPALVGHAHPAVVEVVQRAAAKGLSFGAPTEGEAELAERVIARLAQAGPSPVDQLRLVSTGTEATMTAIRLARGFTGRDLLVKFAGHYHGHSDALLVAAGSGVTTLGIPGSAGVPAAVAANTIVLPYNDREAVERLFAERGDRIAAIISEASAANMGVLPPEPGFNAFLSRVANRHGALFILDEVLTGFRVGPAGWWGLEAAAEPYQPDLMTFGKVIGGGMPLAALGGRTEIMGRLAPLGPVYQAGTLSGNPLAVAAGIATLDLADADAYARLDRAADDLAEAVQRTLEEEGLAGRVQRAGNLMNLMIGPSFAESAPRTYDDMQRQDTDAYRAFFHTLLDHGVALPPSGFEAWFLSAAHDDLAMGRLLEAIPPAVHAAAEAATPRS